MLSRLTGKTTAAVHPNEVKQSHLQLDAKADNADKQPNQLKQSHLQLDARADNTDKQPNQVKQSYLQLDAKADNVDKQQLKAFIKVKPSALIAAKPLLGLSLGKNYHQGEHLKAIFITLNHHLQQGYFSHYPITMLVGGTLQRHNFWTFTQALSDTELASQLQDLPAFEAGDDYLNLLARHFAERFLPNAKAMEETANHSINQLLIENKDQLQNINTRLKTINWSDYVTHVSQEAAQTYLYSVYNQKLQEVLSLYSTNNRFQSAVEQTVDDFLRDSEKQKLIAAEVDRIKLANPHLKLVDFTKLVRLLSRNYLLEEIPFFIALTETCDLTHNLYPAKNSPKALEVAFELLKVRKLEWAPIAFNSIDTNKLLARAEKKEMRQKIEELLLEQQALKKQQEAIQEKKQPELHKTAIEKIDQEKKQSELHKTTIKETNKLALENQQTLMRTQFAKAVAAKKSETTLNSEKKAPETQESKHNKLVSTPRERRRDSRESPRGRKDSAVATYMMIEKLLKSVTGKKKHISPPRSCSAPLVEDANFNNGVDSILAHVQGVLASKIGFQAKKEEGKIVEVANTNADPKRQRFNHR